MFKRDLGTEQDLIPNLDAESRQVVKNKWR